MARLCLAMQMSIFKLVTTYAVRKNGNYYAGKRGAGADYKIGKYKYSAKPQYQNAHITPYRAGEEVLNTSQEIFGFAKNKGEI